KEDAFAMRMRDVREGLEARAQRIYRMAHALVQHRAGRVREGLVLLAAVEVREIAHLGARESEPQSVELGDRLGGKAGVSEGRGLHGHIYKALPHPAKSAGAPMTKVTSASPP